ncbi:MAG: glycosyltransferase family 4 protein, partial [Chthoniobacterales bacterium]
LVLLEAMSSGLPVITTSWRGVASVLPEESRAVVEPNSPAALCVAMLGVSELVSGEPLRKTFERGFTLPAFASRICDAIAS